MSEEPKKSRRRRRRPRSSAKNRAKAASKPQGSGNTSGSSSGNRRSKSRRRPANASGKSKKRSSQGDLTIQRHTEQPISPINKDIFIYTYTLRPRSLLDSYEAGPNVAEKMAFEQPDQPPLEE